MSYQLNALSFLRHSIDSLLFFHFIIFTTNIIKIIQNNFSPWLKLTDQKPLKKYHRKIIENIYFLLFFTLTLDSFELHNFSVLSLLCFFILWFCLCFRDGNYKFFLKWGVVQLQQTTQTLDFFLSVYKFPF